MPLPSARPSQPPTAEAQRASVLLLHGHGRTGASMLLVAHSLRRAGYRTVSPSYGFRRSMPAILDVLEPRIAAFVRGGPAPLHIVTHSLGGLVARALITRNRPPCLGRVVMLAPPNCGSEIADILCRYQLDSTILGPVGRHLHTHRSLADEALLGKVDFDLGVIAGDRPIAPILPRLLPRPNDGLVSVAATRLDGMADHITLPVDHSRMIHNRQVITQTLEFLETGAFRRP